MKTLNDMIKSKDKIDELIEYQKLQVEIARKAMERSQWIKMQPEVKPHYEKNIEREEDILNALLDARLFYYLILENTEGVREKENENN